MLSSKPTLFWFRQDLRLSDQPALCMAAEKGPVTCVYILDDTLAWSMGGASRWWLHHSLTSLQRDLKKLGVPLILRRGAAKTIIPDLANAIGARAVYWNRLYEPAAIARDTALKTELKNAGVAVESFNGSLLFEPWEIKNGSGTHFKVFTPFAKACLNARPPAQPVAIPKTIGGADINVPSDTLDEWKLLPTKPDWSKPLQQAWTIGEAAAHKRLHEFLENGLQDYALGRDRPDKDYTSRISPYLHFGEISPRQAFYAAKEIANSNAQPGIITQVDKFISELLWREFSYSLLFAHPDLPEAPLNKTYVNFPWQEDKKLFDAWKHGQTGIPIVDAGMRQLWQTGWMHNRVRMIAASLLIKNMLQPWQHGAAWFWDTLVDADLASNSASWQWVAGSGADASPYYRIFNPVLQGQKFDAQGDYVRRFIPELAQLPTDYLHAPWEAPASILKGAGVQLGKTYPQPVVDLKRSRALALEAHMMLKNLGSI
ncbi:MAG: deoxyribodipyrimidine photo-lyase [Alphaproteobacteria bacterium]|nr:deoxyribodipyrimidine photo-lyase [Alphaproteobacteria bacterium]